MQENELKTSCYHGVSFGSGACMHNWCCNSSRDCRLDNDLCGVAQRCTSPNCGHRHGPLFTYAKPKDGPKELPHIQQLLDAAADYQRSVMFALKGYMSNPQWNTHNLHAANERLRSDLKDLGIEDMFRYE